MPINETTGAEGKSLFITNLSHRASENDLRSIYSKFGHIQDVYIPTVYGTNRRKGIAYVEFASESSINKAIRETNQMRVVDTNIEVKVAEGRRKSRNEYIRRSGGYRDSRRDDYYRGDRDSYRDSHRDRDHSSYRDKGGRYSHSNSDRGGRYDRRYSRSRSRSRGDRYESRRHSRYSPERSRNDKYEPRPVRRSPGLHSASPSRNSKSPEQSAHQYEKREEAARAWSQSGGDDSQSYNASSSGSRSEERKDKQKSSRSKSRDDNDW